MERKVAKLPGAAHPPASRSRGGTHKFLLIFIISAGDAHQFCLVQRKAILISGRSGIVISFAGFQNGGSNDLEGSEDCRSVGGHGNQHVRLRSAQVSLSGVTCPVQEAIFAFELRQAPEGPNMRAERFYRRSSRRRLSCLATAIDPLAQIARLGGDATVWS